MNPVHSSTSTFIDQLNWHTNQSTGALERLASGSHLLAPQDDAAGLAVATRMEAKLRQFDASASNIANVVSFAQTQDGYIQGTQEVLNRMGALAIRAQDGTLSSDQRALFQEEFQTLKDTFNNLRTAQFNGRNLFDGEEDNVSISLDSPVIQLGGIDLFSEKTNAVTSRNSGVTTTNNAQNALRTITAAEEQIAQYRNQIGSTLTELESASEMISTRRSNLQAASSRINDSDVAMESTNLAKAKILYQNGDFLVKQANSASIRLTNILSG